MSKAIEKAEARVKKLHEDADKKRMKIGLEKISAGLKILESPFNRAEFTSAAKQLSENSIGIIATIEPMLK